MKILVSACAVAAPARPVGVASAARPVASCSVGGEALPDHAHRGYHYHPDELAKLAADKGAAGKK